METAIAKSIFSPAIGFIPRGGFDWTCNPYLGCTIGCTYYRIPPCCRESLELACKSR